MLDIAKMVKTPLIYDYFDSVRDAGKWWGTTARTFWSNPVFALDQTGIAKLFAATGEVVERAYDHVTIAPDWEILSTEIDGKQVGVAQETIVDKPFGKLTEFIAHRKGPAPRKVFLAAPLSGHHATLIRNTVIGLLPHADVFVAEWKNARDIPISEGKFNVEDYTLYLTEYMKLLGPDLHVVAICQPAPLALAATALLADEAPEFQPTTLTLMGGPIDVAAAPTKVSQFSDKTSIEKLERNAIYPVGSKHLGAGRLVYPGAMQLAAFMAMNPTSHARSHWNQFFDKAYGRHEKSERHEKFYDEYLSVMDMTAEFYLSTVKRIFQDREIANGTFTVGGKLIDPGKITNTAVITVEGDRDDITAPGQCEAALDLLTGLKDKQKEHYLAEDAGHYGIFSGTAWRKNVLPKLLKFMDANERSKAS